MSGRKKSTLPRSPMRVLPTTSTGRIDRGGRPRPDRRRRGLAMPVATAPAPSDDGTLPQAVRWLALHPLAAAPWVWSVGNAHQGNFSTLATGRADRHGFVPVGYGITEVADQHPAPWWWDHACLLASLPAVLPGLGRPGLADLGTALLDEYQRTLARVAEDDELALRLDLHGLPEALKRLIEDESADGLAERFLAAHVAPGGDRLRRGRLVGDGGDRSDAIVSAIDAALAARSDVTRATVLDLARCLTPGADLPGRRRWWALARDEDRRGRHRLRLLELTERRPSALARALASQPLAPDGVVAGLTVAMGDPCQRRVILGAHGLLLRTRGHARTALDPAALDPGDRRRLAHTWGQLLAMFHVEGWTLLGPDAAKRAAAVADDARRRGGEVVARAQGLAGSLAAAHAAFAKSMAMAGKRRGK